MIASQGELSPDKDHPASATQTAGFTVLNFDSNKFVHRPLRANQFLNLGK